MQWETEDDVHRLTLPEGAKLQLGYAEFWRRLTTDLKGLPDGEVACTAFQDFLKAAEKNQLESLSGISILGEKEVGWEDLVTGERVVRGVRDGVN